MFVLTNFCIEIVDLNRIFHKLQSCKHKNFNLRKKRYKCSKIQKCNPTNNKHFCNTKISVASRYAVNVLRQA